MKNGDLNINRILEKFHQWVVIITMVRAIAFICTEKARIKVVLGDNLVDKIPACRSMWI